MREDKYYFPMQYRVSTNNSSKCQKLLSRDSDIHDQICHSRG